MTVGDAGLGKSGKAKRPAKKSTQNTISQSAHSISSGRASGNNINPSSRIQPRFVGNQPQIFGSSSHNTAPTDIHTAISCLLAVKLKCFCKSHINYYT